MGWSVQRQEFVVEIPEGQWAGEGVARQPCSCAVARSKFWHVIGRYGGKATGPITTWPLTEAEATVEGEVEVVPAVAVAEAASEVADVVAVVRH